MLEFPWVGAVATVALASSGCAKRPPLDRNGAAGGSGQLDGGAGGSGGSGPISFDSDGPVYVGGGSSNA
jgi:hypothetical protein